MTSSSTNRSNAWPKRWFGNAYLLLGLASMFFAGNAIAGKLAAGVVSPVTLTFFRWVVACCVILPLAMPHLRRDLPALRRHWLLLFAFGAFGFAAFNLLLYAALVHTTAINVTIEQSAMPVLIVLLNYIAFRQRIAALQALGIAATIFGVLLTATRGQPGSLLALDVNRGDVIMMGAVVLYSCYAVALRYKPQVHPMSLMFAMFVSALTFSTPFFALEAFDGEWSMPGLQGWLVIAYAGVFPSIASQLFFMRGVELIGSNRAGLFINLVPIFGAVLAVVILGETFQVYHLLGIVLVLGGILLAERFRHPA